MRSLIVAGLCGLLALALVCEKVDTGVPDGAAAPTAIPVAGAPVATQPDILPDLSNDGAGEPSRSTPLRPVLLPPPWAAAPVQRGSASPPDISAAAAVVLDEASGAVLYEKEAHQPLPPASLTKIVTAILALERGNLDAWVETDVDSRQMGRGTVMGLLPGDHFPLRDLLYGLMLPSGNDAALAIGRSFAGSDEAFVAEMNTFVRRLGLRDSHFANPHGLGGQDHVASAYDLALLSRYAMSLPTFSEIVAARSWRAQGSREITMRNINSFLFSYPGADGVKTGYTWRAGQTLAASATRRGHRLYVVVLNAPRRDDDARRLLDWAFANFSWPEGDNTGP